MTLVYKRKYDRCVLLDRSTDSPKRCLKRDYLFSWSFQIDERVKWSCLIYHNPLQKHNPSLPWEDFTPYLLLICVGQSTSLELCWHHTWRDGGKEVPLFSRLACSLQNQEKARPALFSHCSSCLHSEERQKSQQQFYHLKSLERSEDFFCCFKSVTHDDTIWFYFI